MKNKSQVEGSIVNAYLMEEAAKFASFYFEHEGPSLTHRVRRNDVTVEDDYANDQDRLSIFRPPSRPIGQKNRRLMLDQEYQAAHTYVLLNCPEVDEYMR